MSESGTEEEEEKFKAEFRVLRQFHQAPLRFSPNYGQFELRHERNCQTIDFGQKLLPGFSEDKILEVARKPLSEELDSIDTCSE